ncbi:MAG: hypothetical protein C0506_16120 [Anaerolinea sp.]|nr:hypothetical protein [Anaerolinea sp.]
MSFLQRAKQAAGDLAVAGRRQAQRRKLELAVRRLQSRVLAEKTAIGEAVYPLLEAGTLAADVPQVAEHVKAITGLRAEIAGKQAEIAALKAPSELLADSMRNVDANATSRASSLQSAKDVAAEELGNPTDEGGEG